MTKQLKMSNGEIRDASDHPAHHHTEHRPAYGVWCYDCRKYVTTYDPDVTNAR